jgi:glycosyltransferase involved in cell wall biosynthesis
MEGPWELIIVRSICLHRRGADTRYTGYYTNWGWYPAGTAQSGASTQLGGRQTIFSMKALGIVIPTHNRIDALLQCLAHLEQQTFANFEVVVVDDGSTDSTQIQIQDYLLRSPLALRCVFQKNAGPAKARNLGVSLMETPLCLFLGDDIFASPRLVECHVQLHQEYSSPHIAALGLTRWTKAGQEITPFMRWLEASPVQFAYNDLLAGAAPTWHHFYTSNALMLP